MSMNTIQDLFEHGLEDIYHAEHQLLDALEELEVNTEHDEISQAFSKHGGETQDQTKRLGGGLRYVRRATRDGGVRGHRRAPREYEEFTSMDPAQEVMEYHNMAAAERTEHYEIAAYGNLIPLADQLEMSDAADLLEENLREVKGRPSTNSRD